MYQEGLHADLFHNRVGVGDFLRHQTAERGRRGASSRSQAQTQAGVQRRLRALGTEFDVLAVEQSHCVGAADDALFSHRGCIQEQVLDLCAIGEHVVALADAPLIGLIGDEQHFEAVAVVEVVFVVAAEFPGIFLARNLFTLNSGEFGIHTQIGRPAGHISRLVTQGVKAIHTDTAVGADVIADVAGDGIGDFITGTLFADLVIEGPVPQTTGFPADVRVVTRLCFQADQVVQGTGLAAVGHRAIGLDFVIRKTGKLALIGNGGGVQCLEQNDVDYLTAATHIQSAGGAADDLDVVHLRGTDARQGIAGLIAFACHALAIDENLVSATCSKPATTATTAKATAAGSAGASATATAGIHTRNAAQHVLCGGGSPLGEVGSGIANSGVIGSSVLSQRGNGKAGSGDHDGCGQQRFAEGEFHSLISPCRKK